MVDLGFSILVITLAIVIEVACWLPWIDDYLGSNSEDDENAGCAS